MLYFASGVAFGLRPVCRLAPLPAVEISSRSSLSNSSFDLKLSRLDSALSCKCARVRPGRVLETAMQNPECPTGPRPNTGALFETPEICRGLRAAEALDL